MAEALQCTWMLAYLIIERCAPDDVDGAIEDRGRVPRTTAPRRIVHELPLDCTR